MRFNYEMIDKYVLKLEYIDGWKSFIVSKMQFQLYESALEKHTKKYENRERNR